ncbi:hypothetical protein O9992_01170 [Vibrio lentus]|nr:hypothetical protein [Vibrio lentus]
MLSDNQNTLARLSDDGTTITLFIQGRGEAVLTISSGYQDGGTYNFQQPQANRRSWNRYFSSLHYQSMITDFDQDIVTNTIVLPSLSSCIDGDASVITNVDSIDVDGKGTLAAHKRARRQCLAAQYYRGYF